MFCLVLFKCAECVLIVCSKLFKEWVQDYEFWHFKICDMQQVRLKKQKPHMFVHFLFVCVMNDDRAGEIKTLSSTSHMGNTQDMLPSAPSPQELMKYLTDTDIREVKSVSVQSLNKLPLAPISC